MQLENYMINLSHKSWVNAQDQVISPEFFNASLFKTGNVEGFCGEKNSILYISFQGTYGKADILSDLNFKKTNIGNKIKVHTGFYKQYKEIEGWIFEKTINANKIIFSGQSLGGALAVLSAYHIKQSNPKKCVSCITFACPKVGNSKFVESFHNLLIEIKQYKYLKDPVPMIPFSILGFRYLTKQIVFGKKKWYDYLLLINPFNHLPKNYYTFKVE